MSTVAKLTVDLLADARQFEKTLRSAESQTKVWGHNINSSLSSLRAGFAGAAVAAGTATLAVAKTIGQQTDEMLRLSETANMGFEEFQAFTHATAQYGISAAKMADISKDVADKLGDFIATGGGEFKDFFEQVAPKVGLTAQALQGLSGPEVLQRVKNAMDQANVSMEEQVFYLEAIANDASLLAPLLANNGAEARRMAEEFERANKAISEQDAEKLRTMNRSFNDMAKAAQTAAANIIAKLAPAITVLNRTLTNMMTPDSATASIETALDRLDAGIAAKKAEIESIQKMTAADIYQSQGTGYFNKHPDAMESQKNQKLEEANQILKSLVDQRKILQAKLDKLNQEDTSVKPPLPEPPAIKLPALASTTISDEAAEAGQRVLDNLRRQLATQEELIKLNYQKQVDDIKALVLNEEQIRKAGYDNLNALQADYLKKAEADRDASLDRLNGKIIKAAEETGIALGSTTAMLANYISAEADMMTNMAENFTYNFSAELADMVTKGKADFASLAESIINQILQIAIQAKIVQPLMQSMGIMPTAAPTPAAPAARAVGGSVMRGSTYLVGERGPELFTASNSGNITPNYKLGGNTQVNIYTQPGETAETRTRQTEQGDIIEVFMKQVDSRMNEQISRGQGLARTLESRYALSRKSY